MYLTWIDGYVEPPDVRTNGSTMGYFEAFQPSMEAEIVHGGSQTAPLFYDNSVVDYSEITAYLANQPSWAGTLPIGPDWSKGGAQFLVLWFYGDPNNATTEQMYMKINGTKVDYDGDPALVAAQVWTMWSVDLASHGINLNNVSTLTIGLERTGATGGSGMILLDDIQLYTPVDEQAAIASRQDE